MPHIAKLVRAKPSGPPVHRPPRLVERAAKQLAIGAGALALLLGALAAVAPRPVGADQIGSTQAQVSDLQAAVASGAARIRSLTLAYDQANLQSANLEQEVQAGQARLGQLQRGLSDTTLALRREALLSYTGGATPQESVVRASQGDPSVRAEYIQVAAGDIAEQVDAYRTQQRVVASAEALLQSQEQASKAAAGQVAQARQAALEEAASEQAQLDQLQAQLQQLIQSAAHASSQQAPSAAQGLPVDNGIVSVVSGIVSEPPPSPTPPPAGGGTGGVWLQLRQCESSDNYQADTGNGYYGAYQFSQATWSYLGYPGRPDRQPPSMQDSAAMKLQAAAGWGQWPSCSAALGLA